MTTTRRGWRAALDSSLLFAVVVCGGVTGLLEAAPAASGAAGRGMVVASIESGAASVAALADRGVVDNGSAAWCVSSEPALAMTPSTGWLSATSDGVPRDFAEGEDDDDNDDDEAVEHADAPVLAPEFETRRLTHIELDPSVSLESDGHSLRAPPQ